MDEQVPNRRFRVILDLKCQFPEKLYDVANDCMLIKWNRNESVSVISEEEFVKNVMKWYPGFLQIPSIANLKRLFREYGFDRILNQNNTYEWSHPRFIRGRRELLAEIKTRRKSYGIQFNRRGYNPDDTDSLVIATEDNRRFPLRKRSKPNLFNANSVITPIKTEYGGCCEGPGLTYVNKQPYVSKTPYHVEVQNIQNGNESAGNNLIERNCNQNALKRNFTQLMDNYAESEFSEYEYNEWLSMQRKLDEAKVSPEKDAEEKSNEFWWMYKDTTGEIVQTVNLPPRQTSSSVEVSNVPVPCGYCKCCNSISNYVHLFGQIPENIQVIDYLSEEVVETIESKM